MDNTTLVISLICMLICALPFFFVIRARSKRRKELVAELQKAAEKKDSSLTHVEIQGDLAVALDAKNGHFYFINPESGKSKVAAIDLLEYKSCQVIKKYETERERHLLSVLLQFTPLGSSGKTRNLTFYDVDVNFQPTGEVHFAEKWSGILNDIMNGMESVVGRLDANIVELVD